MSAVAECLQSEVKPRQKRQLVPRGPRCGFNRLSPLTQALDLKDIAFASAKDPAIPAHIKAALMRAWCDLHEITMAIRGQGKPKPIEAKNATHKRARETAPAPVNVNGAVDK